MCLEQTVHVGPSLQTGLLARLSPMAIAAAVTSVAGAGLQICAKMVAS